MISSTFEKYEVYYDYTIKQNERPDQLAEKFYEDPYLDWVILMSNEIIDPYYDWVLEDDVFRRYMEEKYSMSIYETKNLVLYYKYTGVGEESSVLNRIDWTISPETYSLYSTEEKSGWTPVYAFDIETEENEAKRNIRILDKNYLPQLKIEVARIFAHG